MIIMFKWITTVSFNFCQFSTKLRSCSKSFFLPSTNILLSNVWSIWSLVMSPHASRHSLWIIIDFSCEQQKHNSIIMKLTKDEGRLHFILFSHKIRGKICVCSKSTTTATNKKPRDDSTRAEKGKILHSSAVSVSFNLWEISILFLLYVNKSSYLILCGPKPTENLLWCCVKRNVNK